MPRGYRNLQVSFAGGEMSPEMYSRYDDARFRSGAARMLNMIGHPRGSVARRPGLGLVLETKDSAFESSLLPFRYSTDQTLVIEMGRATIDTEERGYFRFHVDGGTLLQTKPPEFRSPETTDDAFERSTGTFHSGTERFTWTGHTLTEGEPVFFTVAGGSLPNVEPPPSGVSLLERVIYYVKSPITDEFELTTYPGGPLIDLADNGSGTITCISSRWNLSQSQAGPLSHGFQTGDPIVFTINKTGASFTVAFDIDDNRVDLVNHGYFDGDTIIFSSSADDLPEPLEEEKFYYVVGRTADTFAVSDARGGSPIDFTDAGSGTFTHAVLPSAIRYGAQLASFFTEPNRTYYAIKIDEKRILIARTRADALAARPLGFIGWGTLDDATIAVHYDYRQGATVYDGSRVNALDAPYYLFRAASWGEPGSRYIRTADHIGHEPLSLTAPVGPPNRVGPQQYWQQMSGSTSEVTFANATNIVTWVDGAHGLAEGDVITFTNSETPPDLPDGLSVGTPYYVRNGGLVSDEFQLSASLPDLAIVEFNDDGTGTHTAWANGYYEVPHFYAEDDLLEINTVQSADVMTLAHVDRPAAELKRRGATDWILEDVVFNAEVAAPANATGARERGEGVQPDEVLKAASPEPSKIRFPNQTILPWQEGASNVEVENVETAAGAAHVPDGLYRVNSVENSGATNPQISLGQVESGAFVVIAADSTDLSSTARVRDTSLYVDNIESYVVTALDIRSEESEASNTVTLTNNLLTNGSYNTISWDGVSGATRYRVYKDVNGLFGFIGETDAPGTSFVDDNIAADLSFTPPILDGGLREEFEDITFDFDDDLVEVSGHDLPAGAPVIFQTDDTLPTGIEFNQTYFVLNPTPGSFQLSTTPTGTTPVDLVDNTPTGQHVMIAGAFPGAVTYFEQRRVFGGGRSTPQDFLLTASSTESDLSYSIPTLDSDRIRNRLAARERSQIRHAVSIGNLLMLTSSAEYRLTSLDGGPLTPGSVSARAPTQIGVSTVAPVIVNNAVLFPADRGGHLMELGFADRTGDYVTGDVSLRASHLFENRTIVQMAYQQAPNPIVWAVSSAGSILGFTYIPEEQLGGWHEHEIDGAIESCAVVSEGDEDHLYIVANRGGTRYVERMGSQDIEAIDDVFFVDSGITYDGTATTSIFIPHLASQAVTYLADGIEGSGTVSAGGILTLTTAASTIHAGLPYQSQLQTIPLGMQVDAAMGSGRTKNVNQVWVRVRKSGSFEVGPDTGSLTPAPPPTAGQLQTQLVQASLLGEWDLEGQVYLQTDDPLPFIVAGLTLEVASGG